MYTLGARALVPRHGHEMVLCPDTGYPIYVPSSVPEYKVETLFWGIDLVLGRGARAQTLTGKNGVFRKVMGCDV